MALVSITQTYTASAIKNRSRPRISQISAIERICAVIESRSEHICIGLNTSTISDSDTFVHVTEGGRTSFMLTLVSEGEYSQRSPIGCKNQVTLANEILRNFPALSDTKSRVLLASLGDPDTDLLITVRVGKARPMRSKFERSSEHSDFRFRNITHPTKE